MAVKFFILLFLSLTLVYQVSAGPALSSDFIEQENSCREVCGLCNCDGFYCIDECICECNINDSENLQCIADMKTECDKNGLDYELIMQESTKDRFLRQINEGPHPFKNFADGFVIMKQKRANPGEAKAAPVVGAPAPVEPNLGAKQQVSSPPVPVVAAPAPAAARSFPVVQPGFAPQSAASKTNKKPEDSIVGAPNPEEDKERVALSISPPFSLTSAALDNRLAFETLWGQSPSKMLFSLRDSILPRRTSTIFPTLPPFTLPTTAPPPPVPIFPSLPSLRPLNSQTFDWDSILSKSAPHPAETEGGVDEE